MSYQTKSSADRLADATFTFIIVSSFVGLIIFTIKSIYYLTKMFVLVVIWVVYNLYRFFRSLK